MNIPWTKTLVVLESPFAGKTQEELDRNMRYLRAAMRDCFIKGEAPFASHALYTQEGVLDDTNPRDREVGINAGFMWAAQAKRTVVYYDLGVSSGMRKGIENASHNGREIEFRTLGADWDKK